MKIALRVDASVALGTGHFMRCMTLANALRQRGVRTRFISRDLPEHLRQMACANGHEFGALGGAKPGQRPDQTYDAAETVEALGEKEWDWLVVDHYGLDAHWEARVRSSVRRIMVIDDLAHRVHECDLLLDQNLYANAAARYEHKVPARCRLLLGP